MEPVQVPIGHLEAIALHLQLFIAVTRISQACAGSVKPVLVPGTPGARGCSVCARVGKMLGRPGAVHVCQQRSAPEASAGRPGALNVHRQQSATEPQACRKQAQMPRPVLRATVVLKWHAAFSELSVYLKAWSESASGSRRPPKVPDTAV
eukprot:1162010-Pelagomonas_calceolata.AAC.7